MEFDYQFGEAARVAQAYHGLADSLRTAELRPIAANFERNMNRVLSHVLTPLQLVYFAGLTAKVTCQARMECGCDPDDASADQREDVSKAVTRLSDGYSAMALSNPLAFAATVLAEASASIPRFLATFPHLTPGIEATLAAMTMDAWSAFEALAADLWRVMVNVHPHPLATNCIKARARRTGETEPSHSDKQIPLHLIQKYNFDVSRSMGDILADTNKFSLDSFEGIIHAYKAAFPTWSDELIDRQGLSDLEALRNLYAHRGGIIDSQFIKRARSLRFIQELAPGQTFHMDGASLKSFLHIVIMSGMSLVHFADGWASNQRDEDEQRALPLIPPAS